MHALPRRPLAALAALLFGHASLQCAVLGLSMLGVRIENWLPWAILLLCALVATSAARHVLAALPAEPEDKVSPLGRLIAISLLGFLAAVFGQLLVLAWLRPVYDWDGLYYHLPAIHEWARAGRVHWIAAAPDVPFVNGYPMGSEVVAFFSRQLLGHDRLVDAANLSFWPIAVLSLIVLARALGAPRQWSIGAGVAIALVPMWVAQSVTGYVDVAFAACCMALLAVAASLAGADARSGRVLNWLLAPALGLCAATKGLGQPFALLIFLALVVTWLLRQRFPLTLTWRPNLLAPLGAMLVAGYWPLRNLWYTGNPLHPVGLRVGSWQIFEGVDARAHTLLNLPHWLSDSPAWLRPLISWTQPDAPIVGYGAISGLGYVWILAGLPCCAALLFSLRRLPAAARWSAVYLMAVGGAMLMLQPAAWWARFTLWLHALGLPAAAAVFGLVGGYPGAARRALRLGLVTLLLGIGIAESLFALRAQWRDGLSVSAPLHYVESARYVFPSQGDAAALRELLDARRVARSSHSRWGTLLGGALAQPVGAREILFVDENVSAAALAAAGYEWLVWDVEAAGPCPPHLARRTRLAHVLEDRPGVHIELRRIALGTEVVRASAGS